MGNSARTHCSVKVAQAELVSFGEEFSLVHAAGVQDNVGSFRDLYPLDDVVLQRSSHGEVHHWVEPQGLIDEALHHLQVLVVGILGYPLALWVIGEETCWHTFRMPCVSYLITLGTQCTHDGAHLLHDLLLHVWVLLQQHQHEEQADGQCVGSCDHHLQHTLTHVVC